MSRIELNLKPSWRFFSVLMVLHLLAIAAIGCANIFVFCKIVLMVCVLMSGYCFCWFIALHHGERVISKCYFANEQWILADRKGRIYQAEFFGARFVSPYVTILNFRLIDKGKRKTIIIFSDSLDGQTFRKFRVELLG